MDRYPDRQSLLRVLPGDWRKRPLDHAQERTSGNRALDQTVIGRGYS
jgi:hypothetical protein